MKRRKLFSIEQLLLFGFFVSLCAATALGSQPRKGKIELVVSAPLPGTMTVPVDVRLVNMSPSLGKVRLSVWPKAVTEVVDCSTDDIELSGLDDGLIDVKEAGVKTIRFYAVFCSPNGEYSLTVIATGQKGEPVTSQDHCFIIEKGRIYDGAIFDHCLEKKIWQRMGIKNRNSLTRNQIEAIENELKSILEERRCISNKRKKDWKLNHGDKNYAPLLKVKKDSPIFFYGKWTANGRTSNPIFPIQKARIIVKDTVKSVVKINDHLDENGKYIFNAWEDDPQFSITLEMDFSGFDGKDQFSIHRNTLSDPTPKVISIDAGTSSNMDINNTITYISPHPSTFPTNSRNEINSAAWSVYHCIYEIFRLAKRMDILRNSPLNVYFISFDTGGNEITAGYDEGLIAGHFGEGVYLDRLSRFDWDVVGHEMGHMFVNEYHIFSSNNGDEHDGTNQYNYVNNIGTYRSKIGSLNLAFSEGFATYFGVSLLQQCQPDFRKIKNVGDSSYDQTILVTGPSGTVEKTVSFNLERYRTCRGEDAEFAIAAILWDLYDSEQEKYVVGGLGLSDQSNWRLRGVWSIIKDAIYIENISYLWNNLSLMLGFIFDSYPFCELGVAPLLIKPKDKEKWDINDSNQPLTFRWQPNDNTGRPGTDPLILDQFTLAIYGSELKKLWEKKDIPKGQFEYSLDAKERQDLISAVGDYKGDLFAVVFGSNDGSRVLKDPIITGPYASNPARISRAPRLVAVVVDSSSSNQQTDPNNTRVAAAKDGMNRLVSAAEARLAERLPDLAAAIDFDEKVAVLHGFDDPPAVAPAFDAIDSSGLTAIDLGIDAAVALMDQYLAEGHPDYRDHAAIVLMTDDWNNAGPEPVRQAIARAQAKGIHVMYGFHNLSLSQAKAKPAGGGRTGLMAATGVDPGLATAVLDSGGVFAVTETADDYLNFMDIVFRHGLTGVDCPLDSGGTELLPNAILIDRIPYADSIRSDRFFGAAGDNAQLTVTAEGFSPDIWVISDLDGSIVASAGDDDLDGVVNLSVALPGTGNYYLKVKAPGEETGLYAIALHGVSSCVSPAITASAHTVYTCRPGEPIDLEVTASGTAPLSYTWYQSADGEDYEAVSGAPNAAHFSPSPTRTTYYRVEVGNACSEAPAVSTSLVTVYQPTAITAFDAPAGVCAGQPATLTATAGGEGTLRYAWSRSDDGAAYTPIAGAEGAAYTTPPLTGKAWFKLEVANACSSAHRETAIEVGHGPAISVQPRGGVVLAGQSVTLAVTAAGLSPLAFQWYEGAAGDITRPASGATAPTFATPPLAASAAYWVRVSDPCGFVDSAAATLSVNHPPVVQALQVPASAGAGLPVSFSATAADTDGDPVACAWDFGDGGTGAGANVTHTYAAGGAFTVTVSVSDGRGGEATGTATIQVTADRPPQITTFSVPAQARQGRPVAMAVAATDPDGDALTYAWSFGDGGSGAGTGVTYIYAAAGTFTVSVTAGDNRGGIATATAAIQVQANRPPQIQTLTVPAGGETGTTLTFTATATDADGDALAFAWSFGDGGSATGANATHTYLAKGDYTVSVTVADGDGGLATSSAVVAITGNSAPLINGLSVPERRRAGTSVAFSTSAYDPDGDALTYAWDFGDGGGAAGDSVSHVYTALGTYSVSLSVTDSKGAFATGAAAIVIGENTPPVVTYCHYPARMRKNIIALDFFTATGVDPEGDPVSYTWDMGDGYQVNAPSFRYSYHSIGTFTVTLTVTDSVGASSVRTGAVEVVENQLPQVTQLSIPAQGAVGVGATFSLQAVDLDDDEDHCPAERGDCILLAEWDFGDGEVSGWKTGYGRVFSAVHTYTKPGVYTVAARVQDITCSPVLVTGRITIADPDAPVIAGQVIPKTAVRDEPAAFAVQAVDFDGAAVTYTWDFGDGTPPTAGPAGMTHTFTQYGVTRQVSVIVGGSRKNVTVGGPVVVLGKPADPVAIPDPKFKSALLPYGDTNGDGVVTYAEAAAVTGAMVFNDGWCYGDGITNLTGLEAFINAVSLDLSNFASWDTKGNFFNRVPYLGHLGKLEKLSCQHTKLTGFDGLPDTLKHLNMSSNDFYDQPPLPTGLKYLDCNCNKLYGGLKMLPAGLEYLDCSDNNDPRYNQFVKEFEVPMLPPALKTLIMKATGVFRLEKLPLPPGLERFVFTHNGVIANVPPLPNSIKHLDLSRCPTITSISRLPDSLEYFDFGDESIWYNYPDPAGRTGLPLLAQLPDLSNLTHIKEFHCTHTHLSDITGLERQRELTVLDMAYNKLGRLPDFSQALKLTQIDCHDNLIAQAGALPSGLKSFKASLNRLTALPGLSATLNELDCSDNLFTVFPSVASSTRLITLKVAGNDLTGLPDLRPLTILKYFDCSRNRLTDAICDQVAPIKPQLDPVYSAFNPQKDGVVLNCPDTPPRISKLAYPGVEVKGTPVDIVATASDFERETLKYTWKFGSQTKEMGAHVKITYSSTGRQDFSLTVTDTNNNSDTAAGTVFILDAEPEVLGMDVGGKLTGLAGAAGSRTFISIGLFDDANPLRFALSGGSGNCDLYVRDIYLPNELAADYKSVLSGSEESIELAAGEPVLPDGGTVHSWYVMVYGASAYSGVTLSVSVPGNQAPAITAAAIPSSAAINQPAAFAVTAADPEGDQLFYYWDFGDGGNDFVSSPTYTYSAPGNYQVSVTVTDYLGGTATATGYVAVVDPNDHPPQITGSTIPGSAYIGAAVAFSAQASDPDGDTLTYTWNFGDASASASGASVTHAFTAQGSYSVSVTVTDGRGGTASASGTIRVDPKPNLAPEIRTVSIPTIGCAGIAAAFAATAVDPENETVTFTWNFGDGTASATGASLSHTFTKAGTYTVSVTAADPRGGSTTASGAIQVVADDGVTVLNIGSSVKNLSGAVNAKAYYKVIASNNLRYLSVTTSGGTGNCDLYLKAGAKPTETAYDYRSNTSSNTETVTITLPGGKIWYIMLRATKAYSGVTLAAAGEELKLLGVGDRLTGLSGAKNSAQYFKVVVPASVTKLRIATSLGSGNCDLYVKQGALPSTTSADYTSKTSGTTESVTINAAGGKTWYILLQAPAAFQGVTLEISIPAGG